MQNATGSKDKGMKHRIDVKKMKNDTPAAFGPTK
jgi:hypothetical protein